MRVRDSMVKKETKERKNMDEKETEREGDKERKRRN
jgi:hypothetical protein